MKQALITIENLSKEINAQEISLAQRYRDFEQESKKVRERSMDDEKECDCSRELKNYNQLNENGNQRRRMVNDEQLNRMN